MCGITISMPIRVRHYSGRRQVLVPQGISAVLKATCAPTPCNSHWPVAIAGCGRSKAGRRATSPRSRNGRRWIAATSAA
uniref:Uncharacterized protein n=1 Tax=Ralstonia solanacearum CFBP2957 TaxID=859656 RepID=D8P3D1_RALSL|nr:protein of unknown function [Ralstonia solanacearum CFBP2957]